MAEPSPNREMKLEIGQFSHPGRKRSNNEDWLGAFHPEDPERLAKKGSLFLVADGMGGHRSGEMASRTAVDHVIRAYVDDPNTDVTTVPSNTYNTTIETPYSRALRIPTALFLRCLVKKLTVIGIMGNTQGVKRAANPARKLRMKRVQRLLAFCF